MSSMEEHSGARPAAGSGTTTRRWGALDAVHGQGEGTAQGLETGPQKDGTDGLLPTGDVRGIASRFSGGSVPIPEEVFQQSKGKQASLEAKALHAGHRGRGDDFMSEHERNRRLEELARRRAEAEAREFLHSYSGSALHAYQLLLSLSRARLGLPLSDDEQKALDMAAAQPSSEGGGFFASALRGIDESSIAAERARAFGGQGDYRSAASAGVSGHSRGGTEGMSDVHVGPPGGSAGRMLPPRPGSFGGMGTGMGMANQPITPGLTPAGRGMVASPEDEGYSSDEEEAAQHVEPLVQEPLSAEDLGTGHQQGDVHPFDETRDVSATEPGAAALAQEEEAARQRADAEARASQAASQAEVARLMTLITSIVQARGMAMTLGDVSAGLSDRTGRSWGAYWEGRHGPLLPFLRAYGTPGTHIITRNKWLSLPGMPIPSPRSEATFGKAPQPAPAAAQAGPSTAIQARPGQPQQMAVPGMGQGGLGQAAYSQQYSMSTQSYGSTIAYGQGVGMGQAMGQGMGQGMGYGQVQPGYGQNMPGYGQPGMGMAMMQQPMQPGQPMQAMQPMQPQGQDQWDPFDSTPPTAAAVPGQQVPAGGAGGWDWDTFETQRSTTTTMATTSSTTGGARAGVPQWHADAAPFGAAPGTAAGQGQGMLADGRPASASSLSPTGYGGLTAVEYARRVEAAAEARRKQEQEDAALARQLAAEEEARVAGGPRGGRRASAPATTGGMGRQMGMDTVSVTGSMPSSTRGRGPSTGGGSAMAGRGGPEEGLEMVPFGTAGHSTHLSGNTLITSAGPYGRGSGPGGAGDRYMATTTESTAIVGPYAARPLSEQMLQRVRSAPGDAMRVAGERYNQFRGYGQMAPAGDSGEWQGDAAHAYQHSNVTSTTTTSMAQRRHSYHPGSGTRGGISGGSPGGVMTGYDRSSVNAGRIDPYGRGMGGAMGAGSWEGAPTATIDEEAFAVSTLQRGVSDEGLTWADFDLLFRPLLVHGFTLIKHGRMGPPKTRRFWMSRNLGRLYWDTSRLVEALRTGERHIDMEDVVDLIDGSGTDLMRQKAARGEINPGNDRYFSLVTVSRTFDLEAASSSQKKVLVRAFKFLIRNMGRASAASRHGIYSRSAAESSAIVARSGTGRYAGMSGGPGAYNAY